MGLGANSAPLINDLPSPDARGGVQCGHGQYIPHRRRFFCMVKSRMTDTALLMTYCGEVVVLQVFQLMIKLTSLIWKGCCLVSVTPLQNSPSHNRKKKLIHIRYQVECWCEDLRLKVVSKVCMTWNGRGQTLEGGGSAFTCLARYIPDEGQYFPVGYA